MSPSDILECLKIIKTKNCEGFDKIPQRVLSDGAEFLTAPLGGLFKWIYEQKKFPNNGQLQKSYQFTKRALSPLSKIIVQLQIFVQPQNFLKN